MDGQITGLEDEPTPTCAKEIRAGRACIRAPAHTGDCWTADVTAISGRKYVVWIYDEHGNVIAHVDMEGKPGRDDGPVLAALLEATRERSREMDERAVAEYACPTCNAPAGEECVDTAREGPRVGERRRPHAHRRKLSRP